MLGRMIQACASCCPCRVMEGKVISALQVGKLRNSLEQVVSNGVGMLC